MIFRIMYWTNIVLAGICLFKVLNGGWWFIPALVLNVYSAILIGRHLR